MEALNLKSDLTFAFQLTSKPATGFSPAADLQAGVVAPIDVVGRGELRESDFGGIATECLPDT